MLFSIKRLLAALAKTRIRQSSDPAPPADHRSGPPDVAEQVILRPQVETPPSVSTIDDIIRVERVKNAEFYVGDLFRRRFGSHPPDYPIHFVAIHRIAPNHLQAVGYVHYLAFEDSYLCGGLVIDERRYRRMRGEHRSTLRGAGGIAEILLRAAMVELATAPAIWGYVGDLLSEKVNMRVGLQRTAHQYLMVRWSQPLPQQEKDQRLARVAALGPF